MSQHMLKSELDAICVKHKHQYLEGMVSGKAMASNAVDEVHKRFVQNAVQDIVHRLMTEYEPIPPR